MKYYSEMLTAIFRSASTSSSPKVLALIDGTASAGITALDGLLPLGIPKAALEATACMPEDVERVVGDHKATCVFAFPPLMNRRSYSKEWRKRFGQLGCAEVLAETLLKAPATTLLHGSDCPVECLALLVPKRLTSSVRSSEWRERFFPQHDTGIIEHAHAGVHEGIGLDISQREQLVTLVFKRQPGPIRFAKITDKLMSLGVERISHDMRALFSRAKGIIEHGCIFTEALVPRHPCSFDFYSKTANKLRQEASVLGKAVKLHQVADILRGFAPCPPDQRAGGESGFLAITGSAISSDGKIAISEAREHAGRAIVRNYLQDGDLCVREITPDHGRLAVGVFEGDGKQITTAQDLIIVRPHPELSPAQREVLIAFLRSPIAYQLAKRAQTVHHQGMLRVLPKALGEFSVPVADEDLSTAIQQLGAARTAFKSWIEQIDRDSVAILQEASATGSRARILGAGRLARQRHKAGEQVEELDFRIRTQFPHPLAYMWRALQSVETDPFRRLRNIVKAAEGHTAFLAMMTILMSKACNRRLSQIKTVCDQLSGSSRGTTFGHWSGIIRGVNKSNDFRDLEGTTPFFEVTQLAKDDGWSDGVEYLSSFRNDEDHHRMPDIEIMNGGLQKAEKALEDIYRASEFLTDYQLVQLVDTRFDSFREVTVFRYRDLTGDNVLTCEREDQAARADLEKNSLYLRDRQGHLHLFRPLLHYMRCPIYHEMATFYLDGFDKTKDGWVVRLKSLERSTVRSEHLVDDFVRIGLFRHDHR